MLKDDDDDDDEIGCTLYQIDAVTNAPKTVKETMATAGIHAAATPKCFSIKT